jgi:hypothetical protein
MQLTSGNAVSPPRIQLCVPRFGHVPPFRFCITQQPLVGGLTSTCERETSTDIYRACDRLRKRCLPETDGPCETQTEPCQQYARELSQDTSQHNQRTPLPKYAKCAKCARDCRTRTSGHTRCSSASGELFKTRRAFWAQANEQHTGRQTSSSAAATATHKFKALYKIKRDP